MSEIYDTAYFDKEFFEQQTVVSGIGIKGGDRIRGNPNTIGILYGVAMVLNKFFNGKRFMEIGGGVGWITHHLQNLKNDARCIELSQYAVDNAICDRIEQGDIRNLSSWSPGIADVVFAWNVLAYLAEEDVSRAIQSMMHVSSDIIIASISTEEVLKIRPHGIIGRKCIKPYQWWHEQFMSNGLIHETKLKKEIDDFAGGWNIHIYTKT